MKSAGIKVVLKKKMATHEEMTDFAMAIEEIVRGTDYTYIEAIVEYCKETGLEIELAATLINPALKAKIQNDALERNMLKEKISRLPI